MAASIDNPPKSTSREALALMRQLLKGEPLQERQDVFHGQVIEQRGLVVRRQPAGRTFDPQEWEWERWFPTQAEASQAYESLRDQYLDQELAEWAVGLLPMATPPEICQMVADREWSALLVYADQLEDRGDTDTALVMRAIHCRLEGRENVPCGDAVLNATPKYPATRRVGAVHVVRIAARSVKIMTVGYRVGSAREIHRREFSTGAFANWDGAN